MPTAAAKRAARVDTSTEKFAARRVELARAALSTLSQLGYARSSLREIAQNSQFSHGVLHYYFKNKHDLITCSIREFKIDAIARFEATLAPAGDLSTLLRRMGEALASAVVDDGATNRFWYDLRAQALFDPGFRGEVVEIYSMLQATAGRFLERLQAMTGVAPPMSSAVAYATFDGLFQRCMLRHAADKADAIPELLGAIRGIVEGLLRAGAARPGNP